ncbi:hypothetical protein N431DRAFT_527487 [Stipitochalara longipes BDJ]|nr:hypothetical protein N431DRAFT_527487 [Stipitochalara longipes BDJ]
MPNIGKPSRACHLCRKRRVDCDLTLPGCLRCAKVQKQCPGYRLDQDLLFHNQDIQSVALKSVHPRRKKRFEVAGSGENFDSSVAGTGKQIPFSQPGFDRIAQAQLAGTGEASVLQSAKLVEHWNEHSIPVVFQQFFKISERNPSAEWVNFVSAVYKENNAENSCLRLATTAAAKAYFSHLACGSPNDKELAQIYGRALRAINFNLEDPKERVKDSTILAMWLLGILELVHHLAANTEGPPQSLVWLSNFKPHLATTDRALFATCHFFYRISMLYPRIIILYTTSNQAIASDEKEQRKLVIETTALITEVDALQSDIQTWTTEHASQSSILGTTAPGNILRGAQLKLLFMVSLLISHVASSSASSILSNNLDLPTRHQKCSSIIHSLTRDILSGVPSTLADQHLHSSAAENPKYGVGCWVDAVQLLFPIIVVCRVPAVSEPQRKEAIRVLQRIGTQTGIRFARDYASNSATIMLEPFKPLLNC